MSIYKVAQRYEQIVRQASTSYADLVGIHEMAQALAMDPYEDLSPEQAGVAIEIAKLTAALADRAYRSGLSASELQWTVNKIKNKLLQYAMNPELDSIQSSLGAILSKLQRLSISDIPAQMGAGSTYKAQPGVEIGEVEEEVSEEGSETPSDSVALSPELRKVVEDLVDENHHSYDDEVQPFHGESIINPARSN